MNRRSLLRLLGLAPIAVPPAVAGASRPAPPLINCSDLEKEVGRRLSFTPQNFIIEMRPDGSSVFASPAEPSCAAAWEQAVARVEHAEVPITREMSARIGADSALSSRIDSMISRIS